METTPPTKSAWTLAATPLCKVVAEHKVVRDPECSSCPSSHPDFRLLRCSPTRKDFILFYKSGADSENL